MSLRITAVAFALAVTPAAPADEARAPLADSKQQLQQLQKDEAGARNGGGDATLKSVLPDLKTTVQGRESLPLLDQDANPNSKEKERQKKRDAKKNWLVDGYDRLDPKAASAKPDDKLATDTTTPEQKEENEEGGKQDDLIKLYEKQAKEKDKATAAHEKQAALEAAHAPASDPLAPFLQNWLANSPVKDAALSSAARPDTGRANVDPMAAPATVEPVSAPSSASVNLLPGGTAPKADNPYLLSLTMPSLSPTSSAAAPMFPIGPTDSGGAAPVPKSILNGPADLLPPASKQDLRKPPMTPADEDKKYYPQLKRF